MDPYVGNVFGRVIISNYRLVHQARSFTQSSSHAHHLFLNNRYVAACRSIPFTLLQSMDESHVQVPHGTIEKLDKLGGQSSRGELAYGIEISCKARIRNVMAQLMCVQDMRIVRLACRPENHSRRKIVELVFKYAFPYSNDEPSEVIKW